MRSRKRHHLVPSGAIALVGALLLPGSAGAQGGAARPQAVPGSPRSAPAVIPAPSDTVRVSWTVSGHRPARHEGVVTEAGPDVIILRTSDGIETIPAAAVTAVEFGHSRTSWEGFKHGFTIGGLFGGLAGILAGAAMGSGCEDDFLCPGPAGGAAIMGTMFGVGGGLLAGLAKAASPGVEWRDAPVRATAAPAPGGGATVGLRVSF